MNILPLVLALVLMLSILTVEKLEKYKNSAIVQREYQQFLKESERAVFNEREIRLYDDSYQRSFRQLTFRYLFDKEAREKETNKANQYRLLIAELMKIVYSEAGFYKEIESHRPKFIDEMLTAIELASDEAPKKFIKRTKDLARLQLEDPELQKAFYHMLKGSMSRKNWDELENPSLRKKKKAYPSLFTYIHMDGKEKVPTIRIALSPREVLKAIFVSDEVVDAIIEKRKVLGKNEVEGSELAFKNEFINKRRPGIDENLLNFELSKNSEKYD